MLFSLQHGLLEVAVHSNCTQHSQVGQLGGGVTSQEHGDNLIVMRLYQREGRQKWRVKGKEERKMQWCVEREERMGKRGKQVVWCGWVLVGTPLDEVLSEGCWGWWRMGGRME